MFSGLDEYQLGLHQPTRGTKIGRISLRMTLVLDIHSIIKVYISVIAFPFDSILIEQGKNQKKGKIVIKIKEK